MNRKSFYCARRGHVLEQVDKRPHPAPRAGTVLDFFRGKGKVASNLLALPPSEIALPAVVSCEVWVGVLGSRNARRRLGQYGHFLASVEILPFDLAASRRAAEIRRGLEKRGQGIGPLDTVIAASALANDATLVSRNLREFRRVPGLRVVDWFT